jgi:hypothetical protein
VARLLRFLLSLLTSDRQTQQELAWQHAGGAYGRYPVAPSPEPAGPADPDGWPGRPGPAWPEYDAPRDPRPPRRRRFPRWAKWTAVIAAGLIFRKAIASVALVALSAALHLVGVNVHLPSIKLTWPWQTSAGVVGTTTNIDLGPWVLQRIEGISRPALGRVNFSFLFTHKVSKNIGIWPCWYASTFYAVGYASATVDLNPGPAWWAPATGHYELQVLSKPAPGKPGAVAVTMILAAPAPSVRARRDHRRHAVEADIDATQLDVSRIRMRRSASAAVSRVRAVRGGAAARVL